MKIEEKTRKYCEDVLLEKNHWEFKLFLKRIYYESRNDFPTIEDIIKKYVDKYPENKDIQYISGYIKYLHNRNTNTMHGHNNTLHEFDKAIELGSIEAAIDQLYCNLYKNYKTWDTLEKRLEWINRFPNNGYLYYVMATTTIKYDYDNREYSHEIITECISYLEKTIELGHDYAKYKLSYIQIKYCSNIELGLQLYLEAENKYQARYVNNHDNNLAYYWRHRDNMIDDLLKVINKQKDEIEDLNKTINKQNKVLTHLYYSPGNPGAVEAMNHFNLLSMKE